MKIVKNTNSELYMKQGIFWIGFIFVLFFGGGPLLLILKLATDVGVTEIYCERIRHDQVDCIKTQSRYFGLIESTRQSIYDVDSAQFVQEVDGTESDCDCDEQYIANSVALKTSNGLVKTVAEEEQFRNNVKGDEVKMRMITRELNNFLKSNEPRVSVKWDNRFSGFNLFASAFLSIFVTIGFLMLCKSLKTKTLQISKVDGKLIWSQLSLFGRKLKVFDINQVSAVKMKSDIHGGYYQDFSPTLILNSGERRVLDTSQDREEMFHMMHTINAFLGLSTEPES